MSECTYMNEYMHVCDCYTDKLHSSMFQWWPSPSSGHSHLHEPKHCYCKLSTLSCKYRFTSCPHAYRICTLCQTKVSGLKFRMSCSGSDMTHSCQHNSSHFTLPIFAHSWDFSFLHALQSINQSPSHIYINQRHHTAV